MLDFVLNMPTKIHFGKGEVQKTGDIVKGYAKKVLVVTGRSSAQKSGTLEKVLTSLKLSLIHI